MIFLGVYRYGDMVQVSNQILSGKYLKMVESKLTSFVHKREWKVA